MKDSELLDLVGRAVWPHYDQRENDAYLIQYLETWNPLSSDGDALRVQITLRIPVHFPPRDGVVMAKGKNWVEEPLGQGDDSASTRRAIVRAAAELAPA